MGAWVAWRVACFVGRSFSCRVGVECGRTVEWRWLNFEFRFDKLVFMYLLVCSIAVELLETISGWAHLWVSIVWRNAYYNNCRTEMNANTSKCRANAIGFPSQGNRSEKAEVLAIGPSAHRKFKGQVPSMSTQVFGINSTFLLAWSQGTALDSYGRELLAPALCNQSARADAKEFAPLF